MQRYEKYKDSGVDWIGEIPVEWNILKLKFLFKDVSIKNRPDLDLLSVTQDQGVVPRSMVENRMVMPNGNLESFKVISKGDFAISLRSFEGGLEYSEYEGLISPAYTVLKSQKEIIDNYFKFLFKSKAFISELQLSIVGIREGKNISYEELKYSYTPIPTLEEQQTIANFLDDKTAKIDQTIAIKQKEIELLKERRQILIQKAVTKGLDDTVTLKDSGVDWIGDIPEHWEVRKITYLFSKIGSGTTPTSGDLRYYDGVINFLQTGDLNDGYIISTSKTLKEKALRDFTSLKIYPKESLVIAMYGATIGKLGILNIDSATNQACCVLSNPRNVLTKYFFFVLLAFRKEIVSMGYGGGQPNISQDLIKSLRFPIANLNEQIQIVSYLEVIEEKISKAILLKQQEIEKLKEYKTVLIDQVVTGKVKIN
ncbi:restriction endonuclease subunit S [Epilithonimonas hominis]|uniref:restriction endonuclease subunit S n=1 Tax=Epilithonimonas hominis TaxID=420404 RepID=UPI0028A72234|nr:restriction endonuclease subunit S [Epilithonimonas hominis]